MEIENLISKLSLASKYSNNNGKNIEANELDNLSKQLQGVNVGKKTLEEIKSNIVDRCGIRWLGEIYIKEMKSSYEGWNFLGSIKLLAEKL